MQCEQVLSVYSLIEIFGPMSASLMVVHSITRRPLSVQIKMKRYP
jgi:hypothetical protein